jgi:hypothetical protein
MLATYRTLRPAAPSACAHTSAHALNGQKRTARMHVRTGCPPRTRHAALPSPIAHATDGSTYARSACNAGRCISNPDLVMQEGDVPPVFPAAGGDYTLPRHTRARTPRANTARARTHRYAVYAV